LRVDARIDVLCRIRRNYPFAVRKAADGAAQPQPYRQGMLTEIIVGADGTPQARDARKLTTRAD